MPTTRSQETILIIEAMNIGNSGASASNKRSAFVVEPEGANEPSARHQMKKTPMGPFSFGGGRSLKRTRLQPKFPANREKYREFRTFL